MTPAHYLVLVDTMARLSLRAEARRFYLGYFWWILEPLLYVAVFYVVFYGLLGTRTPDFLMFLAVGKLTFVWFSKTVNAAANSIVSNGGLLARMDMPKTLFPLAVILECSYRQGAVFVLLFIFVLLDGRLPTLNWLWVIPIALAQALLIIACGLIAAVLVCVSRDFLPLINLGMIFMMFMSGVFWDLNSIGNPELAELVRIWNPIAFLLDAYRQALLWNGPVNGLHLGALAVLSGLACVVLFKLMDRYSQRLARRVIEA